MNTKKKLLKSISSKRLKVEVSSGVIIIKLETKSDVWDDIGEVGDEVFEVRRRRLGTPAPSNDPVRYYSLDKVLLVEL